jgi:hypothetical protein
LSIRTSPTRSVTALKSAGFDIEEADIGEPEVMIKFVAAAAVATVTIMQLVRGRDGTTEEELTEAFEPDDQPVLEALSTQLEGATAKQKNPHTKGTLAFAAWVIARLGGWTAYYGKPGTQHSDDRVAPLSWVRDAQTRTTDLPDGAREIFVVDGRTGGSDWNGLRNQLFWRTRCHVKARSPRPKMRWCEVSSPRYRCAVPSRTKSPAWLRANTTVADRVVVRAETSPSSH